MTKHKTKNPVRRSRASKRQRNRSCTEWSFHFDRDGTEDIATLCNADEAELVTGRRFWLAEGDDPLPERLARMWLTAAAPKLLEALRYLLEQTVDMDLKYGIALSEGELEARTMSLAAIAEAIGGAS